MAEEQVVVPEGDGVACVKCDALFEEIMNSFRVAVEEMKSIAAKGKGQEYESQNNMLYNRYFGCALALDTLLTNYFADRLPKPPGEAEVEQDKEEEVAEEAETTDVVVN